MTTLMMSQPSANSLWVKAVDGLPDEQKQGIDFANSEKIDVLKDLREKAEKSRNQFLASRWKYTRKSGETVIMRDLFEKFVRWVDMFKQVGDVLVQYDPAHASLPWAGIRLILQIAVNDAKRLESVMEDLTWISELICRYTIVEALYIFNASTAHKELENAIVKLYASILSHLSYIMKYFGQGTAKRLIKSTGSNHAFDASLDDIRTSQKSVEDWRSLADSNDNSKHNSKLTDLLNDINKPLKRIDLSLEKVVDSLDRPKRNAILQWLSPEPYLGHHKQVKEGLLKDTGKWLLDDPIFKKWKDDSASSILWLHGIAGSGKSKLVSMVIDDAMNNFQARNSPQPIYFYCSRNPAEPTRSDPRAILASIARQLSAVAPGKPLLEPTIRKYEKEEDEGFASGPLEIKDIRELIMSLIELYPQTTIIIDAMDECDPQKRGELLEFLEIILQNASSLVKVFVSSRNDQDIVCRLKNYPNLRIDSRSNGEDIARFVEYEVDCLIQQEKLLRHSQSPDQLKKLIVSTTIKGAHEMFRWASMQLQHLCLLTLDDDIKKAVDRPPPGLLILYNELYDLLSNSPGELRATIFKNALHWMLSAQTTLEPKKFLMAVTLVLSEDQRVSITQEQLLEICNNFIVYDSQLHTFRFAHLSVREFLEGRPEFSVPSSNKLLAETCLWTMLSINPCSATQKLFRELNWKAKADLLTILELKGYTDLFWGQHCRLAGDMRKSGPLQVALKYLFLVENDDLSILFSNGGFQQPDILYERSQQPKSTIALWMGRVVELLECEDSSAFQQVREALGGMALRPKQLSGSFNQTRNRDIDRISEWGSRRQLLSCRPREALPAPISLFVVCVYDLEELGKELLVGEVLTRPYTNDNGESIYRVAAENRSRGIISHLVMQKEFGSASAEEMIRSAGISWHKDVAEILIQHWKTDTQSKKVFLMNTLKVCSQRTVEEFLNAWEDVPITQEMVLAAIGSDYDNINLVKILFGHARSNVKASQEIIERAARISTRVVAQVEFLLSQRAEDMVITEQTVKAISYKTEHDTLMALFLRDRRKDLPLATPAVMAICKYSGTEVLEFLLDEYGIEAVFTTENIDVIWQRGLDGQDMLMELFKRRAGVLDVVIRATQELRTSSHWIKQSFRFDLFGANSCRIHCSSGWKYYRRSENGWKPRES